MGLSAAERNKRKRERKKREKEERRAAEAQEKEAANDKGLPAEANNDDVMIEYVAEPIAGISEVPSTTTETKKSNNSNDAPDGVPLPPPADGDSKDLDEEAEQQDIESVMRRFQERSMVVVSDDDAKPTDQDGDGDKKKKKKKKGDDDDDGSSDDDSDEDSDDGDANKISKRKLREMIRPTVAELKRRVKRPDLVEAHDVTAFDPDFLIELKAVPGSVSVPRHWGRKRKYLQGKRGFEKKPFELPDFIVKTGIAEVRDTLHEDEAGQSAKQKNRGRVAPKMGAIDIDYKTLHDAFFKHQSKPKGLTKMGDTYYEGKELETQTNLKPGGPFSEALRDALGMVSENSPPPWLNNMQRFGPPPSYPTLRIPGLNAPLPSAECQYGYHPGGWGKPPVDAYGRPLYGGNPFDPPGSSSKDDMNTKLVTSHGKELGKVAWGALPEAGYEEAEESEEESSDDEMDESESEEEEGEETADGIESVLPPPGGIASSIAPLDLRKQQGDETPMDAAPKQLYQVLPQAQAKAEDQAGAVFTSSTAYVVPTAPGAPDGAASVLSKAMPSENAKKKKKEDDDEDLGKGFKF